MQAPVHGSMVESTAASLSSRRFPDQTEDQHAGRRRPTIPPTVTPTEIIHVDNRTVACDGGDGALGHPARLPAHRRPAGDLPVLLAPLHPEPGSRPRQRTLIPPADVAGRAAGEAAPPKLHLVLIDGSGFIFRAFHALPPMTRPDGTPVNAVFGFTNMLAKLLQDHVGTHIAVIFDAGRATFRNRLYDAYKAQRPPPPDGTDPAIRPGARRHRGVRRARDRAGGLGGRRPDRRLCPRGDRAPAAQVTIVSSDKDLMQLIRPGVDMLDPIKQKPIGPAEVMEKFGVPPGQGGRGAGADGRQRRQRARRARHRPEERRAADRRVRRPRGRAGRRARR